MSQIPIQHDSNSAALPTDFLSLPPSSQWELKQLPAAAEFCVWMWRKPAHLPQGLVLQVPDETYRGYPHRQQLTLRNLLFAVGVNPAAVAWWSLCGATYSGQGGMNPCFDQPLPDPLPGADRNLNIQLAPQMAQPMQTAAPQTPIPAEQLEETFAAIEADWTSIQKLAKDLAVRRKQLQDMQMRLSNLNRDLSSDEKLFGDNRDKSEWQDARRWMRDVSARVARFIKDHDIGESTTAAKRTWLEQTYDTYIGPRQPFDGLRDAQREFEAYRKLLQMLFNNMNTAYATASQEGERRAQTILSRLATKVRFGRRSS